MKKYLFIAVVLLVAAAGYLFLSHRTFTYRNPQYGVQVAYTAKWTYKENGKLGIFFTPKDQKTFSPHLQLYIEPLPSGVTDLAGLTPIVLESLRARHTLSTFDAPANGMLSGQESREITYKSSLGIKDLIAFTIKNGKIYEVMFEGDIARYDALLPDVRQMITSFAVIGG